jgi:hypothetical protein
VSKKLLLLCYHIFFFFEKDKTEKLSNWHYADIQTCVGSTNRYFITFTRRPQRDRAGTQIARQDQALSGHVSPTWTRRCQSHSMICMQIELCPRGNWPATYTLSVPSAQLLITTLRPLLYPSLTDPYHIQEGDLYRRSSDVNATIKSQDTGTKVAIKILSASCLHLDRKSMRLCQILWRQTPLNACTKLYTSSLPFDKAVERKYVDKALLNSFFDTPIYGDQYLRWSYNKTSGLIRKFINLHLKHEVRYVCRRTI